MGEERRRRSEQLGKEERKIHRKKDENSKIQIESDRERDTDRKRETDKETLTERERQRKRYR